MKDKHIPKRMCVACREMKEKNELIKVTFSGGAQIDRSGKLPGRGAYVCKNRSCIEMAEKKKGFERAFRCDCRYIYEKLYEVAEHE